MGMWWKNKYIKYKGEEIMKQLPEVNASFGDLYRTLYDPIRTKLILTGIELGIFNLLTEPKTADSVALNMWEQVEKRGIQPLVRAMSARVMADVINSHPENTRQSLGGLG